MNNPDLKRNPFITPDGYFSSFEERLRERIAQEEVSAASDDSKRFFFKIKSVASMAASLLILFGLGYGIMSIVSSLNTEVESDSTRIVYIEEGFLRSSFIDFMYDDIEFDQKIEPDANLIDDLQENITLLLKNLSEEDLIDYYLAMSNTEFD